MPDSAPQNVYVHNHGIYEGCGHNCPANEWWERPGADDARVFYNSKDGQDWIATHYPGSTTTNPPATMFNSDSWYPNAPLTSNEKAFLWVANNSHEKGGTVLEDTSHWRIIDHLTKKNIYEFLKASEKIDLPMLWGYVVFLPDNKMYVKFLTHISPGKQDLEYISEALPDIEDKFNRQITDYDIEETHTPILESYTPQNVETTGFQGTDPTEIEDSIKDELNSPSEEPDYEAMAGEFKDIRQDMLESGIRVSTVFLGPMAPDPENPFETLVYDPEDITGKSLEVYYDSTKEKALNTHFMMVDKYNRKALGQQDQYSSHTQVVSYFGDPGILAADVHPDQMRLLPDTHSVHAVEITPPEGSEHENGERPFMWHEPSNTLFYTTQECHHMHIIPQINEYLKQHGHNYYGPWVTGDITSPEHTGDNWIKFLGTDTGHYPESVINYMQQKYGPRDLMHSGDYGWEGLPEELIQKG